MSALNTLNGRLATFKKNGWPHLKSLNYFATPESVAIMTMVLDTHQAVAGGRRVLSSSFPWERGQCRLLFVQQELRWLGAYG